MRQPNGVDCGVFAAAFLFEWACHSLVANLDVRFNHAEMRKHLARCLERQEVVAFPRARPQRTSNKRAAPGVRITRYITL